VIGEFSRSLALLAPLLLNKSQVEGAAIAANASKAAIVLAVGITLADRGTGPNAKSALCQSETVGVMEVRYKHRFGTDGKAAAAQIRSLIDSISRNVQSLDYDIEAEEERTGCCDCRDPAYSVFARSLSARRDNLAATIAALQERLMDAEALTSTPNSSEAKLRLSA